MAEAATWPRRALNTGRLASMAAVERRVPFWPAARIERLQRRWLRGVIRHAYETVPYYRRVMDERGLRPHDFRTAADLARLPLIDVAAFGKEPGSFLSSAHPAERCARLFSGGGSGTPHAVYHDAAALLANAAHGERDRVIIASLIGRWVGYRETELAPPSSTATEVRRAVGARTLIPDRIRIERQELSLLDPPAAIARRIEGFRPDVIRGFGSAVGLLFAHYRGTGGAFHRPRAVAFSSDAMPGPNRRLIEEEYGIPVVGTYQAIEALKIGFECGHHRGYHLNVDLYPVRIVDEAGRDVPPGQSGEVVVSNLVNRATVLLNYRLGDFGTLSPEPCPCGRTLPLLAGLDGRGEEVVKLPSGRVVHPLVLFEVFIGDLAVWQYQLVQEEPKRFTVAIVAAPGVDRDRLRERVVSGLGERFVEPVTIDVRFVEAVSRTVGGKVRPIVSLGAAGDARIGSAQVENRDD